MKSAHVEVVWNSTVLVLEVIKLSRYTFIFHNQFHFIDFCLKIIGQRNPDNNLESFCTSKYFMLETAHDLLLNCLQAMHVVSLLEVLSSLFYLFIVFVTY
jgi:hypothetical protein